MTLMATLYHYLPPVRRSQFKCQLAKLPKKVQNMTVSEFFAQVPCLAPLSP